MNLELGDLAVVVENLCEVKEKWYSIGLQLKIPSSILDSIEKEDNTLNDKLTSMIKSWLKSTSSKSWMVVCDALKTLSVGENVLAGRLQKKYLSGTIVQGTKWL